MPGPIWTPYDPDTVIGEFGWLWLDDGPMGPEWHLIQTVDDGEPGGLIAGRVPDDARSWWPEDPAERHRDRPYLPCLAPACEPGVSDALSVTVQWAPGASATHTFGEPEAARRALDAVTKAMAAGRNGDA